MKADSHSPESSLPPIWFGAAIALAFAVATRDLYGVDVETWLLPWFAHIRGMGPVSAFSAPFSNYTPPYLYLLALASPLATVAPSVVVIKLVSYLGHVALVFAVWRLLAGLKHRHPWRAVALIACAPTLFVNVAVLTQCDAYWAAAVVMALAAALDRRHAAMFAWCGLAAAIKLQAMFIGPFFLALALARPIPFRLWLLAPFVAATAMLPAWLAGWPAGDLATIYLRQAAWSSDLSLDAPNVWVMVQLLPFAASLPLATIAAAATGLAVAAYVGILSRRMAALDPIAFLRAACVCALIVPGLLPRMHERYFFLADVIALAMAFARPSEWRLAAYTQAGSGLAILAYLTEKPGLASFGALFMLAATWFALQPALYGAKASAEPYAPALAG